jgi:fatty-acyl-CoA synthase
MTVNFSKDDTFSAVLYRHYIATPEKVSVRLLFSQAPALSLSYCDIIEGSARYAQALLRAGIKPGEVAVIILNHGEDLIYAFFGAVLAGAIPSIMPFLTEKLSPDQYRLALSSLFRITQPAAAITYPEFVTEVERARGVGEFPGIILVSSQIEPISDQTLGRLHGFNSQPTDIVLLQHSSGTTGLQKGVALSHQAVFNQLNSYSQAIQLSNQDVIVSWLPLYHDMGLIAGFLMPILCGIPLVLLSPFDWVRAPYKLLQAVSDYRGTLSWLPNFAYNFCAQKIRDSYLENVDLSSWRAVINCSEPMYWSSHQMFLERFSPYGFRPEALACSYAMAENVFAVTQGGIYAPNHVDQIDRQSLLSQQIAIPSQDSVTSMKILSAGEPIDGTRLRILDQNDINLPDRKIGEIAIQSNCMLSGYYNRPDLTEKAFLDGWYLTGDLGYVLDGELYITGRKKDLIIVGGKNIYPQDLEQLAGEVKGVYPGRVVAFGVENVHAGTEDVVIIAEMDGSYADRREKIADEIRQRVTRGSDIALRYVFMVDRGWLVKTSSGKIARSANRVKYLANMGDLG